MNKNLLSIAIIILAIAIVIVNVWEPNSQKENVVTKLEDSLDNLGESKDTSSESLNQFGVQEGNMAFDFELTNLQGETVKLSDYKGKKVILNFWATWCPPCKAEMPHMQNFYEKNKENGVEILAVNLTNMDNGKAAIEDFVKEYELTFSIPLDEEGVVGTQYQAFTIPTSYIVDTNGLIQKKIVGPMDEEMMTNLINSVE